MSLIKDFLKEQEQDLPSSLPAYFKLLRENPALKQKVVILQDEKQEFEAKATGLCMESCWSNLKSP
jgi:hypothetical protein